MLYDFFLQNQIRIRYAINMAAKLVKSMEESRSIWHKTWDPAFGTDIPFSYSTGLEYTGMNLVNLMCESRPDPRWVTFKQALSMGGIVRRGEKGEKLLFVTDSYKRQKRDKEGNVVRADNGEVEYERVVYGRKILKQYTIFNYEQTLNLPPNKFTTCFHEWDYIYACESLLKATGAKIIHQPGGVPGYDPSRDVITLPEKSQFPDPESYYAVVFHELAHWTGHPNRLNRKVSFDHSDEVYAREELRAETASLLLARRLGIRHKPEIHAIYLKAWCGHLRHKPICIIGAIRDAICIVDFILSYVTRQNGVFLSRYRSQRIKELTEESNDVAAHIRKMMSGSDLVDWFPDKEVAAYYREKEKIQEILAKKGRSAICDVNGEPIILNGDELSEMDGDGGVDEESLVLEGGSSDIEDMQLSGDAMDLMGLGDVEGFEELLGGSKDGSGHGADGGDILDEKELKRMVEGNHAANSKESPVEEITRLIRSIEKELARQKGGSDASGGANAPSSSSGRWGDAASSKKRRTLSFDEFLKMKRAFGDFDLTNIDKEYPFQFDDPVVVIGSSINDALERNGPVDVDNHVFTKEYERRMREDLFDEDGFPLEGKSTMDTCGKKMDPNFPNPENISSLLKKDGSGGGSSSFDWGGMKFARRNKGGDDGGAGEVDLNSLDPSMRIALAGTMDDEELEKYGADEEKRMLASPRNIGAENLASHLYDDKFKPDDMRESVRRLVESESESDLSLMEIAYIRHYVSEMENMLEDVFDFAGDSDPFFSIRQMISDEIEKERMKNNERPGFILGEGQSEGDGPSGAGFANGTPCMEEAPAFKKEAGKNDEMAMRSSDMDDEDELGASPRDAGKEGDGGKWGAP